MKRRLTAAAITLLTAAGIVTAVSCNNASAKTEIPQPVTATPTNAGESFAVLELFTSQGCSSCPSADRLLAKTISASAGKNVFALSFHVDYWNRLGWADPFSKKEFSNRQGYYAQALSLNGSYTPQLVVNGTREFVGSDQQSLKRALDAALNAPSVIRFTKLATDFDSQNGLKVKFKAEGDLNGLVFHFALVSLTETTDIKRGENGGLKLTNQNVVREFISITAKQEGEIKFNSAGSMPENNRRVIAYAQRGNNGKIIGAASAD